MLKLLLYHKFNYLAQENMKSSLSNRNTSQSGDADIARNKIT